MDNQIIVSTNKQKMDIKAIHNFLSNDSYWAQNISLENVTISIENSLCFGIFLNDNQIGFARVVTDCVVFGYLCDLFIFKEYQGHGYSRILMENIMAHPIIKRLKKFILITKSAHFLYKKFGFHELGNPEKFMVKP